MNNGICCGFKRITVWAWTLPATSGVTRQFASGRCAVSEALAYAAQGHSDRPFRAGIPVSVRWIWRSHAAEWQVGRRWSTGRGGNCEQAGILRKGALQNRAKQKFPLQLVFVSLAAAAVPAALLMLPNFPMSPWSGYQPTHRPTATLEPMPDAIWPRLMFSTRVAARMVVLLSILVPLAMLYPISWLHRYARTLWLGLLRLSLRWCGPAFTKWAQWVSARGDLLPHDVRAVLETLQNAAPTQSHADIMHTLQQSLPAPVDEVFARFDMEPAGCGAIAQVHRATLTPEAAALCGISPDQDVAVKVKKRGVESNLRTDFLIMQMLARLLARIPVLRDLRFEDSMRQFGLPLHQQLDFNLEAENLSQFAANFRNNRDVIFPRPLWPFVSSDVLVETFIPGSIVRHYVRSEDHPLNRSIAKIGLGAYLQMMLVDNWQHADLHPGNIIVVEQGVRVSEEGAPAVGTLSSWMGFSLPTQPRTDLKLAIIDVGMTVSLQHHHYLALIQLYDGIAALDGPTIGQAMVKLRYQDTRVQLDLDAFCRDIEGLFRHVDRQQFRDQTQEVCGCVLETMRRHRVTMDAAAVAVLITTLALEGWATKLDPDIRILESISETIPRPLTHRVPAVLDLVYADVLQLP